jgi:hypothetical protein
MSFLLTGSEKHSDVFKGDFTMSQINSLLEELDEGLIAARIGMLHDNARMGYQLRSNTAADYDAFIEVITDYYNYHFQRVYQCGPLSRFDAEGRATYYVNQAYRQQRGDVTSAFKESRDSVNGGLRRVLDAIADAVKAEHVEAYIENVFRRYVDPVDPESRTEIIRQFMAAHGSQFASVLYIDRPELYARDYKMLIRTYADVIRQGASAYRRM